MKKAGYAESTIDTTSQRLKLIAKHCNLNDPESVRAYIASKDSIDLHIKTAKHGKVRTLKLKQKTLAMLKTYVSKYGFELSDVMFSKPDTLSKAFQRARNRIAKKFHDPEIFKIRLMT